MKKSDNEFGEVVFEMLAPDSSVSQFIDYSDKQQSLAIATIKENALGAAIYLVDIGTGKQRLVLDVEPTIDCSQTFIHSIHFSQSGEQLFYSLNEKTRLLDLETGSSKTLGSYHEMTSNFGPFNCPPVQSGDRKRYLLFDSNNVARVIDAELDEIFCTNFDSDSTFCSAAAISRSGGLVAFYMLKKYGIVPDEYGKGEETNQVQIWNVDTSKLIAEINFDISIDKIGFTPDENQLVIKQENAKGPTFYNIDTGEKVYHFEDEFQDDRLYHCYDWEFSNKQNWLAIGSRHTAIFDLKTKREITIPYHSTSPMGRTYKLLFSEDGKLLISGGDGGGVLIRKLV